MTARTTGTVIDICRRILIPLDGSPVAEQALPLAKMLANVGSAGVRTIDLSRAMLMYKYHKG